MNCQLENPMCAIKNAVYKKRVVFKKLMQECDGDA